MSYPPVCLSTTCLEDSILAGDPSIRIAADGPPGSCYAGPIKDVSWFLYGGCGTYKDFPVTPGQDIRLNLSGDICIPNQSIGHNPQFCIQEDTGAGFTSRYCFTEGASCCNDCTVQPDLYTPLSDHVRVAVTSDFYLSVWTCDNPVSDNCPDVFNPDQADTDADGMGDVCDPDIDNDGFSNASDAFPYDPTEWIDTDNDGVGNNSDPDDDNDGFSDVEELAAGSDPLDAASVPINVDPTLENFNAQGGFPAYLANPENSDLRAIDICDGASAFAHWRDSGLAEGRGFAEGELRTDQIDGSPDTDYSIDGGFSWEYPGANTVVFVTRDAPKPAGWDGRELLLERCQTFNLGGHYNAQTYRDINTDVRDAIDGGLVPSFQSVTDHYVKYGFKEGRLTNSDWTAADVNAWRDSDYFEWNPDVQSYFLGAQSEGWILFGKYGFAHWINFGRYEGRIDGQAP